MNTATVLPTHAGSVRLLYEPTAKIVSVDQPGNAIVIPVPPPSTRGTHARISLHPLLGGRQFLAHFRDNCGVHGHTVFLGCDEQAPFATGVTNDAWNAFMVKGEQAFYEMLTPAIIIKYRRFCPDAKVIRQGDIWALALPEPWNGVADKLCHGKSSRRKILREDRRSTQHMINHPIFGTRHLLTGRVVENVSLRGGGKIYQTTLVSGILTAPDHAPVNLGESPHIVARAANIFPVTDEQKISGWEY